MTNDDNMATQDIINYIDKIDVSALNLYPFFRLDELGLPVFNEILEVEDFIGNYSLDNIKDLFREYSFTDYFFISTKGVMLTFLVQNPDYSTFCRNKLINSSNVFYYDHLLSYKYKDVSNIFRKIVGASELPNRIDMNTFSDEIKDRIVKQILQDDKNISKRLKYNYFLILARSYIQFKELFESQGSSCLNEVYSEMWEFLNKGSNVDSQEKVIWSQDIEKIHENTGLLVLFEALKEAGYISYGKTEIKTTNLFEGLLQVLPGMFMIDGKNGPQNLKENHISKIKGTIKDQGYKTALKQKKYDYGALQLILDNIVNDLKKVNFDRKDVYRSQKNK